MRYMRTMSIAVMAMAATAFLAVGSASATILEVGGTSKNESVTFTMSMKSGASLLLTDTFGVSANTCTESHVAGKTERYFSTVTTGDGSRHHPTGAISELTFNKCDHTVTVHNRGQLYVEWTSGTNGRVYSENAEVTSYSTIHGTHINCKTPSSGVVIGTLTGVASGSATMDINAVLNCGPHLSSVRWTGHYTVTSPSGLGVSDAAVQVTTLETDGIPRNESLTLTTSLKAGTSMLLTDTFGITANTCTESHVKGKTTSPYTGSTVTGPVEELTFNKCDHTVTIHNPGKLYVEWTFGTNGGVYSEGTEVTMYSTIHGTHVNCKTGTGTPIGTITGVASGNATLDINATVTCGPHLHSARWTGTYTVTSPSGLGVSDTAPAPSLEIGGSPKNESITLTMSLKSGASLVLRDTFGFFANTCAESHVRGATENPYIASIVTGPVEELTFDKCAHTVTVHKPGQLYVEPITGSTNGRVYSENAEVTSYSTIHGTHVNCKTGIGTLLGTLTGVKEGHATLDVNATLNCGPHLSSAKWIGTYTVTSPTGLGVTP